MARAPFSLAGHTVMPGQRLQIDVPVARLYTHTPLHIPVEVVHGRKEGPVMLVCGGIHGDEINGVEIVRRLLRSKTINSLRGTLIAVPVVNVFGFLQQTRYLPDRRDLNRCFPGSEKGSLGGRIAALFRDEIVDHATHILREGSLRHYAQSRGIPVLTYEAGEALRFDEWAIVPGVQGVLRVMRRLGMLTGEQRRRAPAPAELANGSSWARAPIDGILRPKVRLGAANEGEALYHIARFDEIEEAETAIESFQSSLTPPPDALY